MKRTSSSSIYLMAVFLNLSSGRSTPSAMCMRENNRFEQAPRFLPPANAHLRKLFQMMTTPKRRFARPMLRYCKLRGDAHSPTRGKLFARVNVLKRIVSYTSETLKSIVSYNRIAASRRSRPIRCGGRRHRSSRCGTGADGACFQVSCR